jgi:photosynthetic reaction center cytochrome c subunit
MRFTLTMRLLLPLFAQEPPAPARGGRGPFVPKNLKILKAEEVMPAMRSYETGLGVGCNFCHVQGDRASDDNQKKVVARMMIQMVRDVNTRFPEGKGSVTCYTCHRGASEPVSTPPAAAEPARQ